MFSTCRCLKVNNLKTGWKFQRKWYVVNEGRTMTMCSCPTVWSHTLCLASAALASLKVNPQLFKWKVSRNPFSEQMLYESLNEPLPSVGWNIRWAAHSPVYQTPPLMSWLGSKSQEGTRVTVTSHLPSDPKVWGWRGHTGEQPGTWSGAAMEGTGSALLSSWLPCVRACYAGGVPPLAPPSHLTQKCMELSASASSTWPMCIFLRLLLYQRNLDSSYFYA